MIIRLPCRLRLPVMKESFGIIHVLGSMKRLWAPWITAVRVELFRRFTSTVLELSARMFPVSCEPVAVKLVVPDDSAFNSTPLPLVMDDPLTDIWATAPVTWKASAAEFTVTELIVSMLGPGDDGVNGGTVAG